MRKPLDERGRYSRKTVPRGSYGGPRPTGIGLQGYLAHNKTIFPGTLQKAYTYGPRAQLGEEAVSHERGTPVL